MFYNSPPSFINRKKPLEKLLLLSLAIILLFCSCAPVPEAKSLPKENLTQETMMVMSSPTVTQTPKPTATPRPSPTLKPTPKLPVPYNKDFPGKLSSLNAENVSDLQLVGTFGEGQDYDYDSYYSNDDFSRVVIVYSTGLEIYTRKDNNFLLSNVYNFEILGGNRIPVFNLDRDPFIVSDSTEFFAQNYGDHLKILNLNSGIEASFYVDTSDIGNYLNYPIQNIDISPSERYLIIDSYNEQVLIDLHSFEEIMRVHARGGKATLSIKEDYFTVANPTENQIEVYELPGLSKIATFDDFTQGDIPQWATVTEDLKVVSVGIMNISIWNLMDLQKVFEERLPIEYYSGNIELTDDNQYLIIGHQLAESKGVSIWDLTKPALVRAFATNNNSYYDGRFLLSPDDNHIFVYNTNNNRLFNFRNGEVVDTIYDSVNRPYFSGDGRYFMDKWRFQYLFDIFNHQRVETVLPFRNEAYSFKGVTDTHVFFYHYYEKNIVKVDLDTGVSEIVSAPLNYSWLYLNNNDFGVFHEYFKSGEKIVFRDMNDFSVINHFPYRKSYRSLTRGWWVETMNNKTWYGDYQVIPNQVPHVLSWKLDEEELAKAFSYLNAIVEYQNFKPYIHNLVSKDNKYSVNFDYRSVNIIDNKTENVVRSFNENGRITNLKFSPDSKWIFISGLSYDRHDSPIYLKVFDISTGNIIHEVEYEQSDPRFYLYGMPMDVSPDGKYLLLGNREGQLEMIDILDDWKVLYSLDDVLSELSDADIQFSPNSSYFAVAAIDDNIQIFRTDNGKLINEIFVLGDYNLKDHRLIQFYLLDNLILTSEYSGGNYWAFMGQVKAYGIIE